MAGAGWGVVVVVRWRKGVVVVVVVVGWGRWVERLYCGRLVVLPSMEKWLLGLMCGDDEEGIVLRKR